MNLSASTLLHTLSTVGIRSIRFRILSQNDPSKHTTPVATLDEDNEDTGSHRVPRFSIPELFSAYSLTPRKGEYTLEVGHGQLCYIPAQIRAAARSEAQNDAPRKRWQPKISQRHVRAKINRKRKFPSA
jgi:hypothetical protein